MNKPMQAFLRQCKNWTANDTRDSMQMRFIIGLRNKLNECNDPVILSSQASDLACAANVSVSNLPEELLQDTIDGVANVIIQMAKVYMENNFSWENLYTELKRMDIKYD
jgi:hypothetical protein